jgi:hypothetical protein
MSDIVFIYSHKYGFVRVTSLGVGTYDLLIFS